MFNDQVDYRDAVAFFRYSVILPMLDAEKGWVDATAKELAEKEFHDITNKKMVNFSYRTLYTYYMNYKEHGFDGLKPKQYKNKGTYPSVPDKTIKKILNLKEELPSRSAAKIVSMLELADKIEENSLHVRTVNRILKHYGYTKKELQKKSRVYVKHEKDNINEMWQSDVMSSVYLPDSEGKKNKTYLIAFIDDFSRKITHAQFYFDATLTRLEDCLKKAIIKNGTPDVLYIDNGKIYISNDFRLICARLGIVLKYSKPYHPAGKGKIEKFWQYVQSSFISEVKNNKLDNIIEFNDLFSAWLKREYHDKVHTSLGVTPTERWKESIENGTRLNYISPVELDKAFLHYAKRKVNKYGVISFQGNTYEVDGLLVNKEVGIRYNPFHLDSLYIYYQDKYYGIARMIDLNKEKHRSVSGIEEDPAVDSETSKKYLENIKSDYQKYLNEQLNIPLDRGSASNKGIDSQSENTAVERDDTEDSESIDQAPSELTEAISREEFVEIVTDVLEIEALTFAEKGRLYQLWSTFKEFNREILVSILDDIVDRTPDFNQNFLFYLAQIKKLYLEKVKEAKK